MQDEEIQPGEVQAPGLEPLGRSKRRAIGSIMRAVFDVLYDAEEPLGLDEVARRSFERADGTMRYRARRAYLRQLQANRRWAAGQRGIPYKPVSEEEAMAVPLAYAWRMHVRKRISQTVALGTILRDEEGRLAPNPAKPPHVEGPEGLVLYTREAALGLGETERALGDVAAMKPELHRLLGALDPDALRLAVELAASGYSPGHGERSDLRQLRGRLGWLLSRPTTDAGRAWLLAELVRRAYGEPPAGLA